MLSNTLFLASLQIFVGWKWPEGLITAWCDSECMLKNSLWGSFFKSLPTETRFGATEGRQCSVTQTPHWNRLTFLVASDLCEYQGHFVSRSFRTAWISKRTSLTQSRTANSDPVAWCYHTQHECLDYKFLWAENGQKGWLQPGVTENACEKNSLRDYFFKSLSTETWFGASERLTRFS